MKNKFLFILFSFLTLGMFSCSKEVVIENSVYSEEEYAAISKVLNLPSTPHDYTLEYPKHVGSTGRLLDFNKATLGRVLFYDKKLSSDNSVSCASCHKQERAFSDEFALSPGAEGRVTTRNSLALGSVLNFSLYYGQDVFNGIPFFWDNSANTIQEQSQRTIANPNEMNMHITDVANKIGNLDYYKPLAKKAFGTTSLNGTQILDALAEFTNSITNYNTKFDKALDERYEGIYNLETIVSSKLPMLTDQENLGKSIYLNKCSSCHGTTAGRPGATEANNGLYINYADMGVGKSKGGDARFKVPTLRNIMLTAPYMHDGSLATIDDVLDHYSKNIKATAGLDSRLKSGTSPMKMNFTSTERDALKAFFNTLTETKSVVDVKFSDPFIN